MRGTRDGDSPEEYVTVITARSTKWTAIIGTPTSRARAMMSSLDSGSSSLFAVSEMGHRRKRTAGRSGVDGFGLLDVECVNLGVGAWEHSS